MSLELLNTLVAIATFIVIGATALAALVQLRHLRASNELSALVGMSQAFIPPETVLSGLRIAHAGLEEKMADADYRRAIVEGTFNPADHPEILLCTWFEQVGTFLKTGLIAERILFEWNAGAYSRYWDLLSGPIAITRRRSPWAYQNFEYLSARARKWLAAHPAGTYPRGEARLPVADRW